MHDNGWKRRREARRRGHIVGAALCALGIILVIVLAVIAERVFHEASEAMQDVYEQAGLFAFEEVDITYVPAQTSSASAGTSAAGTSASAAGTSAAASTAANASSGEEEATSENSATSAAAASSTAAASTTSTASSASSAAETKISDRRIIFLGDSRTVQMQKAVKPDSDRVKFVAEVSMGYDWMKNTGIYSVDGLIEPSGTIIVINFGVNDPHNVDYYAKLVNRKAAEWSNRGAKVYYESVNPVYNYSGISNADIEEFNTELKKQLDSSITWIDTYSFLMGDGFETQDGLHYTEATYKKLYNYLLKTIGSK